MSGIDALEGKKVSSSNGHELSKAFQPYHMKSYPRPAENRMTCVVEEREAR
jgi:hypothetical protein